MFELYLMRTTFQGWGCAPCQRGVACRPPSPPPPPQLRLYFAALIFPDTSLLHCGHLERIAVAGRADGREASVEERELRRTAAMGAQHRGIMAPAKSQGDVQKRGCPGCRRLPSTA